MEDSMQGNTSVEVLFPDFKVPAESLSPKDWTRLAFELHSELSGFPSGNASYWIGSIPWLLEHADHPRPENPQNPIRGTLAILPQTIDDSRCENKTKGAVFAATMVLGEVPRYFDWPVLKSPRSRLPNPKSAPRPRRTVHLFISASGFILAKVNWRPFSTWNDWGDQKRLVECGFIGSVVVTDAGPREVESFLRNCAKTNSGAHALLIARRLQFLQEILLDSQKLATNRSAESLERIKGSVSRIADPKFSSTRR
ncbi:hypothetical protein BH11PAT2_BH11PAT2_03770 [soil metagenome]